MESPLISVIIPCYNAQNYLHEAIESIVNQTYSNLEIIILDDGSTDGSKRIYNKFKEKDSRITVIKNTKNIGLISTLNRGIKKARGQFIARMDADDVSEINRIKTQLDFIKTNPYVDIVGTNARPINNNGKISQIKKPLYLEPNTLKTSAYLCQPFFHGSILSKATILKSNPYSLDFQFSEDFELWLRLISFGYKVANIKETLYQYRHNPDGASNRNTETQKTNHNKASKLYLEKLLQKKIDTNLVAVINSRPKNLNVNAHPKAISSLLEDIIQNTNTLRTQELNNFIIRLKVDISIQAIKVYDIRFILLLLKSITNSVGFIYFTRKFSRC